MALASSVISAMSMLLSLAIIASAGGYGPAPATATANSYTEKPEQQEENLHYTSLGVQGLILCKSLSKLTPIEGAVARITCLANDERGYEAAPFSILSDATDAKGYFFAALSSSEVKNYSRLKQCKAFLELSPLDTCNVPTDANNGTTGALLSSSYRLLKRRKMILFSVPPFVFSSTNGY